MDTKYVAISAFVLVAVMIKRIQCDPGDDCASLTQCMGDYGAKFQSAFNPKDAKTFPKVFDIMCIKSNIDALVNCFKPNIMMGCSALKKHVFGQQFSADNMRDQFTKACAQKEEMIGVIECITKGSVGQSMGQCFKPMMDTQSNDQEDQAALQCSIIDGMLKCFESAATGQCSDSTVSFLKSTYQEQYAIICSAPKMVVNVLLLCMLYLLNRLLLF